MFSVMYVCSKGVGLPYGVSPSIWLKAQFCLPCTGTLAQAPQDMFKLVQLGPHYTGPNPQPLPRQVKICSNGTLL